MKHNGSPRLRLDNQKSEVGLQTLLRCDARQHRRPSPASGDVDETWVSSRLWPASSWSAFQSIRTNNDVECWHNRLYNFRVVTAARHLSVCCIAVPQGGLRASPVCTGLWTPFPSAPAEALRPCPGMSGHVLDGIQRRWDDVGSRHCWRSVHISVAGAQSLNNVNAWLLGLEHCGSSTKWKFSEHWLTRSESSTGAKVSRSESSWTFHSSGVNVPWKRKVLLCGLFAPGNESAEEWKVQIPWKLCRVLKPGWSDSLLQTL